MAHSYSYTIGFYLQHLQYTLFTDAHEGKTASQDAVRVMGSHYSAALKQIYLTQKVHGINGLAFGFIVDGDLI